MKKIKVSQLFTRVRARTQEVCHDCGAAIMASPKLSGLLCAGVAISAAFISPDAAAWSAPAAGSFAYDIYDIGVNKLLKGPIGFVAGVGIIAYSANNFSQAPWKSVTGILAGSGMAKADTITTTMGAMVDGAQHLQSLVQ